MSESQTVQLGIDASHARRGAKQYAQAIDQIARATKNLDTTLTSATQNLKKADFSKLTRQLKGLNSLTVKPTLGKNIRSLSSALMSLKGPSKRELNNIQALFTTMRSAKISSASVKNLKGISTAMRNFKAPSKSSITSLQNLFTILNSNKISTTTAKNLNALTTALKSSAGGATAINKIVSGLTKLSAIHISTSIVKELRKINKIMANMGSNSSGVAQVGKFATALKRIKVPRSFSALSRQAAEIGTKFSTTGSKALQLGTSLKNMPLTRTAAKVRNLSKNVRGLGNSMSVAYQASTLLRNAFGALTVGSFVTSMFDASLAVTRFKTVLGVTLKTTEEVDQVFNRVRATAYRFGLDLRGTYREFGKFATAAGLAGASMDEIVYTFDSIAGAARVAGLGMEDQSLIFQALTQMFSKGRISSEELRRQLAERLPGAFQLMQDAIREYTGNATADLNKMLKLGQVSAGAVTLMAEKLNEAYGPKFLESSKRADASLGRLKIAYEELMKSVGDKGVFGAIGRAADIISDKIMTVTINSDGEQVLELREEFAQLAAQIGQGLGRAIESIGSGIFYLLSNLDKVGDALRILLFTKGFSILARGFMGAGSSVAMLGRQAALATVAMFSLGKTGTSTAVKIGAAFSLAAGAIGIAFVGAGVALAVFWDKTVKVGDTMATLGEITQASMSVAMNWFRDMAATAINSYQSMVDASDGFFLNSKTDILGFEQTWIEAFSTITDFTIATIKISINIFKLFWDFTSTLVRRLGEVIGNLVVGVVGLGATIAAALSGNLDDALHLIKQSGNSFYQAGASLADAFVDPFKAVGDEISAITKTAMELQTGNGANGIEQRITESLKTGTQALEEELARRREIRQTDNDTALADRDRFLNSFSELVRPDSTMDVVTDGDGGGTQENSLNGAASAAKSAADAIQTYSFALTDLDRNLERNRISQQAYNEAVAHQAGIMQQTTDPVEAQIRMLQEENNLLRLGTDERERATKFRDINNSMIEKGILLTEEQTAAIKDLIAVQQDLNDSSSRPLQSWIEGMEEFSVALETTGVQAMEGLSDSIADLVVDGKADFASLFKSIMKNLVKLALNELWKRLFSGEATQQQAQLPVNAVNPQQMSNQLSPTAMREAVRLGVVEGMSSVVGSEDFNANQMSRQLEEFNAGANTPLQAYTNDLARAERVSMGGPLTEQQFIDGGNTNESLDSFFAGMQNGPSEVLAEYTEAYEKYRELGQSATEAAVSANESLGRITDIQQAQDSLNLATEQNLEASAQAIQNMGQTQDPTEAVNQMASEANITAATVNVNSPLPITGQAAGGALTPEGLTQYIQGGGYQSTASRMQSQNNSSTLDISATDADLMARVLGTEWVRSSGEGQAGAILDTMMNRSATPGNEYGQAGGMAGVLNKRWQFSGINSSLEGAYGSAANAPLQADASAFTQQYLQQRAGGMASSVGTNTHYLNPEYSSQSSLNRWGSDVVGQANASGQVFGQGDSQHFHGTAQGSSSPESFNVGYGGNSGGQMIDQSTTQGIGGMGLPGGMGMGGDSLGGGSDDLAGLGDSFTQEMETAFTQTSQAFPEAMAPGMDQAAQILPQKLTEDEGLGDSMTSAMQPANQQSAQDFQQQYTNANTQIAQDFAQKMQSSGGGGMGGGGDMGGLGGLGSIIGMIGGLFKTGGIVGSGGRPTGMISAGSLKGARSMKFGGIVGDPDAEPIIAHKGELVTPVNQVSRMKRLGRSAAIMNPAVKAQADKSTRSGASGFSDSDTPDGFSGAQHSTNNSTINMTVVTPDADSFQASKGQIEAQMGQAQARSSRRNS